MHADRRAQKAAETTAAAPNGQNANPSPRPANLPVSGVSGDSPVKPPAEVQVAMDVASVVPWEDTSSYREMVRWVAANLGLRTCPKADPVAMEMWKWAKDNRGDFFEKAVLPLAKREQDKEDEKVDKGLEATDQLVREWMQRRKLERTG